MGSHKVLLMLASLIVLYRRQGTSAMSEEAQLTSAGEHPLLNDLIFNENVLWTRDAVSELQCARMCADSDTCASFTFTGSGSLMTTSCRAHSAQMTSGSSTLWMPKTSYYNVMWLDKLCTHSDNCTAENSQCLSGRCRCSPGYFYSETSFICLAACSHLGNAVVEYPGSYLNSFDTQDLGEITLTDCLNGCLLTTSFPCRSLDYLYVLNGRCLLSDHAAFAAEYKTVAMNVSYFQRTCLNRQ